jgi:LysM repeat protein
MHALTIEYIGSRRRIQLIRPNKYLKAKSSLQTATQWVQSVAMMRAPSTSRLSIFLLFALPAFNLWGQEYQQKRTVLTRVEPGLENAVKWIWRVQPSDAKDWGLSFPTPTPSPTPSENNVTVPEIRPTVYDVKQGDALILIGRKFGLTVDQLKAFNGLKTNLIRVGQKLKIPSIAEVTAAATPTPEKRKKKQSSESRIDAEIGPEIEQLRLQIFLDREQFSAGPIAGEPGPLFAKVVLLYESTHPDAKDDAALSAKAKAALTNVFTHYKLRAEDFRFITPPSIPAVEQKPAPHSRTAKRAVRPATNPIVHPTYDELITMRMLAYRTAWGFVAERFHCQETYLHILNDKLPPQPGIGADFLVPNVKPFEIENALDEPLQPAADPTNPITADVVGLSQLNIYQNGVLIAVFPLSPARPGLHGRGSWMILDAIPRPRLGTYQEERPELVPKSTPPGAIPGPEASPSKPALSSEQYLAAGPRNPVGILWINLAKSTSTEPLPYGLHGTSIPDQMNDEQSLGGFRLTNWDIARAVHSLPSGTTLGWK